MLKNSLRPQGSQRLNRNGRTRNSDCSMLCYHFEGNAQVIGCAANEECMPYDCENGMTGFRCMHV